MCLRFKYANIPRPQTNKTKHEDDKPCGREQQYVKPHGHAPDSFVDEIQCPPRGKTRDQERK